MASLWGIIESVRRSRRMTLALGILVAALIFVASAKAIAQQDANARFGNYIQGRCGNLLYSCKGLVVFGCQRVGSQPGEPQWLCAGDVFERLRNPFGAVDRYVASSRTCEVIAEYAPNGKRVHGSKKCGISIA